MRVPAETDRDTPYLKLLPMDARIERAKVILEQEADAVRQVADRIDGTFGEVVEQILSAEGRLVTTGMGKAGLIAQKISATFASTGTNSIFLHPAEAIHGDLGRVSPGDLVLAFSKSGETEEVLRLLAPVKAVGVSVIAITQSADSSMGKHAEITLSLGNIKEAGALGLAPSASTAAMLALGDALALVVQECRDFGPEDFARFHPGGDLGRRLMKVGELMRQGDRNPQVVQTATVLEAITVMTRTSGRPGATSVVDESGCLTGFFTDGDVRRLLESGEVQDFRQVCIAEAMTKNPRTISRETFALEGLAILHQHEVDQMPVVDERGFLVGLLDVQDLLDLRIG